MQADKQELLIPHGHSLTPGKPILDLVDKTVRLVQSLHDRSENFKVSIDLAALNLGPTAAGVYGFTSRQYDLLPPVFAVATILTSVYVGTHLTPEKP